MSLIVNSFFTFGSIPKTGLTPTIRIWEVLDASNTLIIGGPDPVMSEIADGFYKFVFTTGLGFDETKTYVIRADGGIGQPPGERFSVASTTEEGLSSTTIEQIVDGVWDETATSHIAAGSTGELLNNTAACCATTAVNVVSIMNVVEDLIKYQCNKTEINKTAFTLTIFEDDGTTPLKVFDLTDASGTPSITEICRRTPQ